MSLNKTHDVTNINIITEFHFYHLLSQLIKHCAGFPHVATHVDKYAPLHQKGDCKVNLI